MPAAGAAGPVRAGAVLPVDLAGAGPAELVRFAQFLERSGADHLTLFDHVLGADRSDRDPPLRVAYDFRVLFREPLVLSAFLAARTRTLEFATGVLALPQRPTALVAKQVADLAMLSGGRFRLGVGVGLNPVEARALGAEFETRGARQEEQIGLLRRFWAEELVDFHGRFHHVDRAGIAPLPPAPPALWLGGRSAVAVDRAVRLADGFIVVVHGSAELAFVQDISAAARSAGRTGFGIEALVDYGDGLAGASSLIRDLLDRGVTHLSVRTDSAGSSPESHQRAAADFLAAVRRCS